MFDFSKKIKQSAQILVAVGTISLLGGCSTCCNVNDTASSDEDRKAVESVISQYAASIDAADSVAGQKLFLNSDSTSFIHPKGHERGWNVIKDRFYGMFDKAFSKRSLKVYDKEIEFYRDSAVVTFYWTFDAVFSDGTPIKTKGRETQVLQNIDGAWKIVHVHYSNMPVKGKRAGF